MSSPGQTYSVSIFIEQFIADLGLSRSLVSGLYTVGTITGSMALPFVGRQIDKYGSRRMVVIIAALFGLACVFMGLAQGAFMLGLGFIGIRMLGQGSISLVSRNVLNQWWVRRRGTVLGIAAFLAALLGVGLFPPMINWLIPQFGWRASYMILGGMVAGIMMPVGWLFFRDKPELYGLLPDGALSLEADSEAGQDELFEENWTAAEAVRLPAFWLIALGLASFDMLNTGIIFHMVSIFADSGLNNDIAAAVFVPISAVTAISGLVGGVALDRIEAKYMLSFGLICQVTTLLLATAITSTTVAVLYGALMGITNGLARALSNVVWANYFGRQNLGAISGITSTIGSASSGLGPLWFGVGRDLIGNYVPALRLSAFIPFVLAISALFIRRPRKSANPVV